MLAEAENNDVYFIDQLNELRAKLPSMGVTSIGAIVQKLFQERIPEVASNTNGVQIYLTLGKEQTLSLK
ncbi:hypothetical protein SAMN04487995_0036 [Dyadobacter koreensis]|uniref:Uncharacterized protein n=1 Tax=Dyadobacter koreensis TaxID=408657 RepID=A0A1H6PZN0_9BACT|nr:hypothetical protein [Dyadobacter koreensis]SEI37081.1 hypothetical protein SAMN04487995_0036 [Dyadobacter koreensis]